MAMEQGPSPERFFDAATAYQKSAAMKAAVELGLFTAIAELGGVGATAKAIAGKCRVAERGARILSDYLVILGFLTKRGEGEGAVYGLAEDAALFLDRNSPAYIGGAVEFLGSTHLHDHFDALGDRVRAGGAPLTGDNSLAPSHEMWIRFARGMGGLMMMPAQLLAKGVLKKMGADPERGPREMRVLDIAAGHGMFGIAFLQQNKLARVVGQDWGNVLGVARENAAKLGVLDRYEELPGSAFEVDFGTGFDVVLLPNFLHHFDREANLILLRRVYGALRPGGVVAALEFAPDEDRVTPPGSGAFALVMLTTTPAGDAYTVNELRGMFEEVGLTGVTVEALAMQRAVLGVKGR